MFIVVASSAFEKASVLFSIGALQTQLADAQQLTTDEGLKTAAKLFQVMTMFTLFKMCARFSISLLATISEKSMAAHCQTRLIGVQIQTGGTKVVVAPDKYSSR